MLRGQIPLAEVEREPWVENSSALPAPHMQQYSFVRVTPNFTGVVNANIDDIWKIVKQWAPSLWIKECAGVPVRFHVLVRLLSGQLLGNLL